MREYPVISGDYFTNGIFPNPSGSKNQKYLEVLSNLRCDQQGAVQLEPVTQVPTSSSRVTAWPFPQLCTAEDRNVVFGGTVAAGVAVGIWSGGTTPAVTTAVYEAAAPDSVFAPPFVAGTPFQFAAMRDLWIATNGACLLWHLPYDENASGVTGAAVTCGSVAQHRHRLLLGGLYGAWFNEAENPRWKRIMDAWRGTQPRGVLVGEDLRFPTTSSGTNWVAWSERGGGAQDVPFFALLVMVGAYGPDAFDALEEELVTRVESGELGMAPVRGCGAIHSLAALGDRVIVYGHHGISEMTPDDTGTRYAERMFHPEALSSGSTVGVGADRHLCVLATGDLAELSEEGINVIGFRHVFAGRSMVVTHDPNRKEFWIADSDGAFIWNGKALSGPHDVRPSGLLRRGGTLWATSKLFTARPSVTVRTCPFDMGERGSKHAGEVFVESEGIVSKRCCVPWRVSSEDSFRTPPMVPFNGNGVCFPHQSFVDGKVQISGVIAGNSASITTLGVRFQYEDKRFRRGPTGNVTSPDQQGDA